MKRRRKEQPLAWRKAKKSLGITKLFLIEEKSD